MLRKGVHCETKSDNLLIFDVIARNVEDYSRGFPQGDIVHDDVIFKKLDVILL